MPNRYFVTYDIADDERRNAVYKALRAFGDHLQYSVFRCDLAPASRATMVAALTPLIDARADQILIVDLGPIEGRAATCVEFIGRAYRPPERLATIV